MLGALDVGEMIDGARRKTGLRDFGDEWFLDPFEVLVASTNAEAELTPLGRWIQRQRIVDALANRLRAETLLRQHPEVHGIDLGKVVVIAGLQRTGTTVLHRLIASHPRMRSLLAWEALRPAPAGTSGHRDARRRIGWAKTVERAVGYLAPALLDVHPFEHDAPEEDILLLDMSFMSQTPEATMHVPTYSAWLEQQDHARAYHYARTLMKLLLWQRPGDNWVLKTPHHLEHLDVVLDVFPSATIVQTHRAPERALASFCSMVAHARGMFSDRVDPRVIGAHCLRKARRMVDRSVSVRDAASPEHFVDVAYRDLLRDPMAEVRRVHERTGLGFDGEALRAARRTVVQNVQHRHDRHVYQPASFGLDADVLARSFSFYRSRFGVPSE